MSDSKKDLTGVLEYAKRAEESGEGLASPPAEDLAQGFQVNEALPLETIEHFEGVEELSEIDHPAPAGENESPLSLAEPAEALPDPLSPDAPSSDFASDPVVGLPPPADILGLSFDGSSPPSPLETGFEPEPEPPRRDQSLPDGGGDLDFQVSPNQEKPHPSDAPSLERSKTFAAPKAPAPSSDFAPPPAPVTSPPPSQLQSLRDYAEAVPRGVPAVHAAFPFSVKITGMLPPEEQEKLSDLLNEENMGIRALDLEPQFQAGRILIPRVSEYAAILIVQALRGTRAEIEVGPSDQIFATADTRDDPADRLQHATRSQARTSTRMDESQVTGPERLPLTSLPSLPGTNPSHFTVIDVVSASAVLKSQAVEAESSPEYLELIEALQTEIKYKAYRKGASAVVGFQVQLTSLGVPTHYRITASGSAIRASEKGPDRGGILRLK